MITLFCIYRLGGLNAKTVFASYCNASRTDGVSGFCHRYGVRPDGVPLLPPMPYEAYAEMFDEDMAAMIAYLQSLELEDNEIPPLGIHTGREPQW